MTDRGTWEKRNAVPDCPGWHYGVAELTADGSLYGKRTVTVYGPDNQQCEIESTDGWAGIHRAAQERIGR